MTWLLWQGRFAPFGLCWDVCSSSGQVLEPRHQRKFCTFDCTTERSWQGMVQACLCYLPRTGVERTQKCGFSSKRLYNSYSPSSPCPIPRCWGVVWLRTLFPSCCHSSERCCWYPPGCGRPAERRLPRVGGLAGAICGVPWGMETPKLCYFGNCKLLSCPKVGGAAAITPLVWLFVVWDTCQYSRCKICSLMVLLPLLMWSWQPEHLIASRLKMRRAFRALCIGWRLY